MSKIVSIGTAVPAYCHKQDDILQFMQCIYSSNDVEKRKLKFLYHQSGIEARYSVISDYSKPVHEWKFYPQSEGLEPFPTLEQRISVYQKQAPLLSVDAVRDCLGHTHRTDEITHLITVSCTGMSAPGLDLQLLELLDLNKDIFRTSVNFMGCYAGIHALKIADAFCKSDSKAKVLIVCTELCTIHFQKESSADNITSSLLFGDGSAAVLITGDSKTGQGLRLDSFFSNVVSKGRRDMAWELSSNGFLMTLSSYVPELIEEDFAEVAAKALQQDKCSVPDVSHWCIHPGGKRILDAVHKSLNFTNGQLSPSYEVLRNVGNTSSASIFFVLKNILHQNEKIKKLFAAAFGPGLTIETFTAHN